MQMPSTTRQQNISERRPSAEGPKRRRAHTPRLARALVVAGVLLGLCGLGLAQKKDQVPYFPVDPTPKPTTPKPARPTRPVRPRTPTTASLTVITRPGAQVSVDDKPPKPADPGGTFRVELAAGTHEIAVSAGDDYVSQNRTVVVKPPQAMSVTIELAPRYGTVVISVPKLEGSTIAVDKKDVATLVLDDQKKLTVKQLDPGPGPKPIAVSVDEAQVTISVANLAAGEHAFAYRNPDYVATERSRVVQPGLEQSLMMNAEPAAGELLLQTEPGASAFLDDALLGETAADGTLKARVPVGQHVIKIVKQGFQTAEERVVFERSKSLTLAKPLPPELTRVPFHDEFDLSLSRWQAPVFGWTLASGYLKIAGAPEPGYPRAVVYSDFLLSFNVKLDDGNGASWIVRARDGKNYYLFHLAGPKAKRPAQFFTFVVRDGNLDLASPAIEPHTVTSEIVADGEYYVVVTARGSSITTQLTPLSSGIEENLGTFVDPINAFPYGAPGFRSAAGEHFSVDRFYVDPPRSTGRPLR